MFSNSAKVSSVAWTNCLSLIFWAFVASAISTVLTPICLSKAFICFCVSGFEVSRPAAAAEAPSLSRPGALYPAIKSSLETPLFLYLGLLFLSSLASPVFGSRIMFSAIALFNSEGSSMVKLETVIINFSKFCAIAARLASCEMN